MIRVDVSMLNQTIQAITVTGHAGSGDAGYDLVCAGVSSIMTGALNGFDALAQDVELLMDPEPRIEINIKKSNDLNQTLMEFVILQLRTVEVSNSEYIVINEKEVTS